MKKMMKMATLILIVMLIATMTMITATAEMPEFQAANSDDQVVVQAPASDEVVVSAADNQSRGAAPNAPAAPSPDADIITIPVPRAEVNYDPTDLDALQAGLGLGDTSVTIMDEPVPLGAGTANLVVEIVADVLNPQYGENVTLRSFVVNPDGIPLSYQWQIDRGFGWENLLDANAPEFTFNYNETISGCSFRVYVDLVAA